MSHPEDLNVNYQITESDIAKTEKFARQKETSILVIFFDDMKGSTILKQRLTEQSSEDTFQRLRQEHDELLTRIITREGSGEVH